MRIHKGRTRQAKRAATIQQRNACRNNFWKQYLAHQGLARAGKGESKEFNDLFDRKCDRTLKNISKRLHSKNSHDKIRQIFVALSDGKI